MHSLIDAFLTGLFLLIVLAIVNVIIAYLDGMR
jgi:hypothetical protein